MTFKKKSDTNTDDGDRLATAEQLKYFAIKRQAEIDTRLLNNFGSDDLEVEFREELTLSTWRLAQPCLLS